MKFADQRILRLQNRKEVDYFIVLYLSSFKLACNELHAFLATALARKKGVKRANAETSSLPDSRKEGEEVRPGRSLSLQAPSRLLRRVSALFSFYAISNEGKGGDKR